MDTFYILSSGKDATKYINRTDLSSKATNVADAYNPSGIILNSALFF